MHRVTHAQELSSIAKAILFDARTVHRSIRLTIG